MKINNEFTVQAPIDRAWALLTDVEAIAPCMPGAQLTGIRPADEISAAEIYEGKVKVKMGPVVAEYKGTAVFIEKDDENYRGVIDANGRDSRGAGTASAVITVRLHSDGESTTVGIDTDLKISGKIAQFGAGMIQEVSEKLLGQFVSCLEGKLAAPAEPETVAEPVAPADVAEPEVAQPDLAQADLAQPDLAQPDLASPVATATPARRTFKAAPEPEALDLLDLAGGAAVKRLVPVAIAGAVVVAAVIFFRTRR
ncbi:MAG TPA: SRPBCC domain-containing protein [Kineosporiaceae bacterium]|nr:SRPBCC domain-containing protein [Kineosporiaceae bacterium]